ncbi:MAG: hypothetical protein ACJAZP_003188 [Psychromonas sp.]|jgi:hypothetical protein|uniref:hypothetical protein n=1 Tax=Psychromonas sp. TaxID=1884585 RepID=UPI0039E5D40F
MNIIKKLTSKPKRIIVAGSLLLGLALTPATSFAGNDQHQGHRNGGSQKVMIHQVENNRHYNKRDSHHNKRDRRQMKHKHSHHGKYSNRRHSETHYVVVNNDRHRSPRLGIQIGVQSGSFNIVFRD